MTQKIDPLASYEIQYNSITQHGFDIEAEILAALAQEITIELNESVMDFILVDEKYTKIILENNTVVSKKWLNKYIKNHYQQLGHIWYFKESKDAVLFALKWGSINE